MTLKEDSPQIDLDFTLENVGNSLYNAVIEPSTSYPYDLAQAIHEGRYSKLESGEKLSCPVRVTLGPYCE